MHSSRLIAAFTAGMISLAAAGPVLAQETTTTPANTTTPATTTTATTNTDGGGFDWGWLGLLGLIGLAGLRGNRRDTHVHTTTTGTRP